MMPLTIEQVEQSIGEVYLLKDKGIIRLLLASVIGNRISISDKPIWLLILAGSSSGKTAVLQLLDKCGKWIVPIDTLTTNTFASGLKRDEEVSLLFQANNGILVFKDFTTITSMNEEGLREIMGQFRAIYDGSFNKKTGNGLNIDWKGKIGIIAGGTIASQRKMRQFSEQGERFINYILDVADAKEITKRAMNNQKNLREKEDNLADIVADFIKNKINQSIENELVIPSAIQDSMIDVADFATQARSPVTMNKKDNAVVDFVGDREMPPRMAMMLTNIAMSLMIISDEEELSAFNAQILYKTALDSIPAERRLVLRVLAKYRSASTRSIAQYLNYPTQTVRGWCNQLNALKMTERTSNPAKKNEDSWVLKADYKDTMLMYENIESLDEVLQNNGDEDSEDNAYIDDEQLYADELENFDWGAMK